MKKAIVVILFITSVFSDLSAQISSAIPKSNSIISESEIIGDWISNSKKEVKIEKDEDGKLIVSDQKKKINAELKKIGLNEYSFSDQKQKYVLKIISVEKIEMRTFENDAMISMEVWNKKEEVQTLEKKEKRFFVLYYPSLSSPYGAYAGFMNRKWNVYIGLRCSPFLFYEAEGGPFESSENELLEPSNSTGSYKGKEEIGQSSLTIGISRNLLKDRLLWHAGLGLGIYNEYQGFDLWEMNDSNSYDYKSSVWANNKEAEIIGVQLEAGLILDFGILVSLGASTLNFDKYDAMIGIGYAF